MGSTRSLPHKRGFFWFIEDLKFPLVASTEVNQKRDFPPAYLGILNSSVHSRGPGSSSDIADVFHTVHVIMSGYAMHCHAVCSAAIPASHMEADFTGGSFCIEFLRPCLPTTESHLALHTSYLALQDMAQICNLCLINLNRMKVWF